MIQIFRLYKTNIANIMRSIFFLSVFFLFVACNDTTPENKIYTKNQKSKSTLPKLPKQKENRNIKNSIVTTDNGYVIIMDADRAFMVKKSFANSVFDFNYEVEDAIDDEIITKLNNSNISIKLLSNEKNKIDNFPKIPSDIHTIGTNSDFLCAPFKDKNKTICTYGNLKKLKNTFKKKPVLINLWTLKKNFDLSKLNGLMLTLNLTLIKDKNIQPADILKIKTLHGLFLPEKTIQFTKFLDNLSFLSDFRFLSINKNQITKPIAQKISKLINLKHLYFTNLYFAPGALKMISKLSLEILEIPKCGRMSTDDLSAFRSLKWLNIAFAEFSGIEEGDPDNKNIPAILKSLTQLEKVNFSGLSDIKPDLKLISKWKKLKYASFKFADLSDEYIDTIAKIKTLKYIAFGDSSVTCKGIYKLRRSIPNITIQSNHSSNSHYCNKK